MHATVMTPEPLLTAAGGPGRDAFALDPGTLHLNHGSFGAVPRLALAEQSRLRVAMEAAPVLWFGELPARVRAAREAVADYLRVAPERTALVPNASAGVTVVLNALTLPAGSDVVLTDHAYGAVQMAVERAASRAGARVVRAEVPLSAEAAEATAAVVDTFTEQTSLVVLDTITSATARLLPVEAICAAARQRGITTLVDAAHAPGALADPVTDCDYWVGNLHKHACAPRGTAAVVVRPGGGEELLPLIDSWGAREPYPDRFDSQGTWDATAWLAAPHAFAAIEETFGWDRTREHSRTLLDWAVARVAERITELTGWHESGSVGMPAPTMRLVRLPPGLPEDRVGSDRLRDLMARTHRAELAVTRFDGHSHLRLSAHAYSTAEDFEDFCAAPLPALLGLRHPESHQPRRQK